MFAVCAESEHFSLEVARFETRSEATQYIRNQRDDLSMLLQEDEMPDFEIYETFQK